MDRIAARGRAGLADNFWERLALVLGVGLLSVCPAFATLGFTVNSFTPPGNSNSAFYIGFEFQVTSSQTVASLGVLNTNGNASLPGNTGVGIYSVTPGGTSGKPATAVITAIVPAGTSPTAAGSLTAFMVEVTPTILTPGNYLMMAETGPPHEGFGAAPLTFQSGMSYVNGWFGGTGVFPGIGVNFSVSNQSGGGNNWVTSIFGLQGSASQTITFPQPASGNAAPITLSATASSGLSVSFTSNTPSTCTVSGSTITATTSGACSITATQAGSSVYAPAGPVTQSFTVLTSQTITFNPLNNVNFGARPALHANASSGLTVGFTSNSPSVCAVQGGEVTTARLLSTGTCSISANQGGNGAFGPAPTVTQTFTVSQGTQTILFSIIPNQFLGGSPFQVAAQASSGLPVAIASSTSTVCLSSRGLVKVIAAGTCTLQATQSGNANYLPAPGVAQSFNVSAAQPSGTVSNFGDPISISKSPISAAIGDFNGDGIPDFVTVNIDGTVSILTGSNTGVLSEALGSPYTVGVSPVGVAVGDFNGDGFQDIAVTNSQDSIVNVSILLGNGDGTFFVSGLSPATGRQPEGIVVGDFNGDGLQDLAVTNTGDNTVTILIGDGTGRFTQLAGSPFNVGAQPLFIAVGDFNGDGFPDLVTANSGEDTVTVLFGASTGGFSVPATRTFQTNLSPQSVVVADFNGDGNLDIATVNLNTTDITILLGDGSGSFTNGPGGQLVVGNGPVSIFAADLNGDGIPDLVVANSTDGTLTVEIGNGDGSFTPATSTFKVGAGPFFALAADFNGDGILDVVTGSVESNTVSLLQGGLAQTTAQVTITGSTTVPFGQPVPLTLTVTPIGGFNTPTGTGEFNDNGVVIGDSTDTTTPFHFTATGLAPGSHQLVGNYFGDSRNSGINNSLITINVSQAGQTITFNSPGNVNYSLTPFPLGATASSGLAVTYTSTTNKVCTVDANLGFVTTTGLGTCTINADQAGDNNYAAALTVTQSFTINQGPQTINFSSIAPKLLGASPFAIAAEATSLLPVSFVY